MEPYIPSEDIPNPDLCQHCKTNKKLEGYPASLCTECRENLINYPIPRWLSVSLFIVTLLIVHAIFEMTQTFNAALHFERGEKALEEKRIFTAIKEFEKSNQLMPTSSLVKSRMIAAFIENEDFYQAQMVLDTLITMEAPDNEVVTYVNDYAERITKNYQGDSTFYSWINNPGSPQDSLYNFISTYANNNPNNGEVRFYLANYYYDLQNYKVANQYLDTAMVNGYANKTTYLLAAACERQLENYAGGLKWCDKILQSNIESTDAYAAKGKLYLRKKDMPLALENINKALSIDSTHLFANSVAVLYYNYSKNMTMENKYRKVLQDAGPYGEVYINQIENHLKDTKHN